MNHEARCRSRNKSSIITIRLIKIHSKILKLLQFEKVMHARSGAWRCCDGKRLAARVQCEPLLAATFIVLC